MMLSRNNSNYSNLNHSKVRVEVLKPIIERFLNKISVSKTNFHNTTPCWDWIACKTNRGYGHFRPNGKLVGSYRFSYEYYNGEIPKGLEIDHLCRNPKCVNPKHLEPVTHAENVRRGMSGKINNWESNRTHCPHGHEYSKENIYIGKNKNGSKSRNCRTCALIHKRKTYQSKKIGVIH